MQTRRSAKQWGKVFKRSVVLLCVLLLFFCVGMVFFLTATTYASGSNAIRPTDMSPTTIPTDPPTTVPTTVPTTIPTVAPTTAPTSMPTTAPTAQPTTPRTNPTPPPPVPTATMVVGGLLPPANNPTPQPTMGAATSPTATIHKTATPSASPTAAATTTMSSVVPGANTTSTPSQQGTNSAISLPQIASIGVGGVLLASVLFIGLVWRQRRMQLRSGQPGFAQRSGLYPLQGKAVTEPLHQAPQPLMQQAVPEMAFAASTPNSLPIQYAQTNTPQSLLREQEPVYQEASPVPMEMMQVAETSAQAPAQLLESMMRQAQMGLFALPNKTE